MTTLTVELEKIDEFQRELPNTGCRLTGRMRRVGKFGGIPVRDIEIILPSFWSGSMSDALYNLPGVVLMSNELRFGRIGRILRLRLAIYDFFSWHIRASGM